MCVSVLKAGIDGANLIIALEPEAASLFCQHIPVEKLRGGEGIRPFTPGNRYLVLDAGGKRLYHSNLFKY